jgi:hypothetical protein
MKTLEQKLADVETAMRRWHTRLTRASNALRKLEAKRRRLWEKQDRARVPAAPAEPPGPDPFDNGHHSIAGDDPELSIPPFLKVGADVEAMRAERRAREAAERKAMPLTGRAALDAIRSKPRRRAKSATA